MKRRWQESSTPEPNSTPEYRFPVKRMQRSPQEHWLQLHKMKNQWAICSHCRETVGEGQFPQSKIEHKKKQPLVTTSRDFQSLLTGPHIERIAPLIRKECPKIFKVVSFESFLFFDNYNDFTNCTVSQFHSSLYDWRGRFLHPSALANFEKLFLAVVMDIH